MKTLGITHSACGECKEIIPTKIVSDGKDVYFHKFCPVHGPSEHYVRSDVEDYLQTLRYVKPAVTPRRFDGDSKAKCTEGCGFCERHEQHLCMPIIEITSRCDLTCPVCLVDAGEPWNMTVEQFDVILDRLIEAELQVDVLNLSGGEPLMHPAILEIVDTAMAKPQIMRVSISTNGLQLLKDTELFDKLQERNVVISLQFDGFNDEIYKTLRGRPLLKQKLQLLDMLKDRNVSTSLTVTLAGGVNDDQLDEILSFYFARENLISLMIQPVAFAGRGRQLEGTANRLTIPDVVKLLDQTNSDTVSAADFAPLPCSHPLCFTLAYYLQLDNGGMVSLNKLIDASNMMDTLANKTIFGLDPAEQDRIKDMIYELWSGPTGCVPDTEEVMNTLRGIIDEMSCSCFDPRAAFSVAERRIKSIFIHAFQDIDTFDLARVRRCCNAYPQVDGNLIPACVNNVLKRHN